MRRDYLPASFPFPLVPKRSLGTHVSKLRFESVTRHRGCAFSTRSRASRLHSQAELGNEGEGEAELGNEGKGEAELGNERKATEMSSAIAPTSSPNSSAGRTTRG